MKIIAYYLPQFHEIPENNDWWGKGFTEWTNVKKAKPLFENHYQPRIPLNENYYDLLEGGIKQIQVDYAKEYGIYGFCFYHYWFNGKLLIEKPVEQFLENKNLDIHFCLSWANESWMKTWVNSDRSILLKQVYGGKDEWKKHFDYLLPFFKDPRYISEDNKPLFVIYRPWQIPDMNALLEFWNSLAIKEGFNGIKFISQDFHENFHTKFDDSHFDYNIEYQPSVARSMMERDYKSEKSTILRYIKNKRKDCLPVAKFKTKIKKNSFLNVFHKVHIKLLGMLYPKFKVAQYDYQEVWDNILNMKPKDSKSIPGAFVSWDNTPRREHNGGADINFTLNKFEENLSEQIQHAKKVYKKDMIFFNAWNEWGEGAYLEPDEKYGLGVLKAVKKALEKNNEFPKEDE